MRRWHALALLAVIATACSAQRSKPSETQMTERPIEAVLAAHNDSLMALPGVVGTAIGRCGSTLCIRLFVRDSAAARSVRVAESLEGYMVRVEVSGAFYAR